MFSLSRCFIGFKFVYCLLTLIEQPSRKTNNLKFSQNFKDFAMEYCRTSKNMPGWNIVGDCSIIFFMQQGVESPSLL